MAIRITSLIWALIFILRLTIHIAEDIAVRENLSVHRPLTSFHFDTREKNYTLG